MFSLILHISKTHRESVTWNPNVESLLEFCIFSELDMFDWTAGIRVAYCVDSPLPDLISPFRRTLAKVVTKYCQNATACNLRTSLVWHLIDRKSMNSGFSLLFGPEQIVILEGFPRRESLTIQIKFFVLLPHSSNPNLRQQRPFLPRQVLSGGQKVW